MRYDVTIGVNVRAYKHTEIEATSEDEAAEKARALWSEDVGSFDDCEDSGSTLADVEALEVVDVEALECEDCGRPINALHTADCVWAEGE